MSGEKILVVDDTRLNRELAKDILELGGYQITEAANGAEALDNARRNKPDIILLDIELPDISGLEVIKLLKEDPLTRDITVVALTAHSRPDDRKRFSEANFAGCILKPFDIKSFPQVVAQFLK